MFIAAVIGKQFIIEFGWEVVFFAAGVPVLLIPFIMKSMPESLAYLLKKQNQKDLQKVVGDMEPSLKLNDTVIFTQAVKVDTERAPITQLFQEGRSFSTLMFWGAYFTGLFMVYSLSTWLTKLMAMSGYTLGSAF